MTEQLQARESKGTFVRERFPSYSELNLIERLFLRTCCYSPPRERRSRGPEDISDTPRFHQVYGRAFGPDFWTLIQNRRVLDVGCGEGGFVLALALGGAREAVGLDTNPSFVHAQGLARDMGLPNIEFRLGDITSLNDSSFDVVISHDSFEHFEEPEKVLEGLVTATNLGGRVLIKFGPLWRSPYGRHMSGTVRKSRPWVHLLLPERTVMRVHSVYHCAKPLRERYSQLEGGLNKMTLTRFRSLLSRQKGIRVRRFETQTFYSLPLVGAIPGLREFFVTAVFADCERVEF